LTEIFRYILCAKIVGIMKKVLIVFIISIFLLSCQENIPEFSSQKAFRYLIEQCELGPRYPGSQGIELCREYIISKLETTGAQIEQQEFEVEIGGNKYTGKNIIAHFYPALSRRILIGAHYDTRPWADKEEDISLHEQPIIGANDAASGVAVLLSLAEVLANHPPEQFGIELVFFDMEDMGEYGNNDNWCMGSKYFVEVYKGIKPEKVIVIDMIGEADAEFPIEYYSYHNSPTLVKEIWQKADELGFEQFKHKIGAYVYDDHFPFIIAGFNAVDIIDFEYSYWHTLDDTPDKCSEESLQAVGQTLTGIIYSGK
jgi:Zn-dependent M28 family amino/carboxypeptidase